MICSYCETKNTNVETCHFCGAELKVKRPRSRDFLSLDMIELPQPTLVSYHTYDLLVLLRLVREERTKAYHLMRSVQKASTSISVDTETISLGEEQYRYYTARMKVIEGILIDRMGYKPKRVDEKLLGALEAKMKGVSHEKMV